MEQVLEFAVLVIVISASGVLSPGPLFASNIFYGLKEGVKGGLKVSYGHTVVELPLVFFIGLGALSLETIPQFRVIISVVGAIGLFTFAGLQLKTVFKTELKDTGDSKHGPFLAGIIFSGLNPFFLIWWLSIGFKLISDSLVLWSFWGIAIMFGLHIWMDYAWLGSTAYLSGKISKLLSNKTFKILILALAVALVYFGITFLIEVII